MPRKNKELYEMKLHSVLVINDLTIMRVPGGWIYTFSDDDLVERTSTFVPYDDEFKNEGEYKDEDLYF